jgi:hypothetical protein
VVGRHDNDQARGRRKNPAPRREPENTQNGFSAFFGKKGQTICETRLRLETKDFSKLTTTAQYSKKLGMLCVAFFRLLHLFRRGVARCLLMMMMAMTMTMMKEKTIHTCTSRKINFFLFVSCPRVLALIPNRACKCVSSHSRQQKEI